MNTQLYNQIMRTEYHSNILLNRYILKIHIIKKFDKDNYLRGNEDVKGS